MKTDKPPIIPTLAQAHKDLGTTIGKPFAAFKAATVTAVEYEQKTELEDNSFFSHHVRYIATARLHHDGIEATDEELEDGVCGLERTANTGICIKQPGYLVRVLRNTHGGNLPPAADSERRKRFFAQQTEQPGLFDDQVQDESPEREPVHVVFLWASDQQKFFTGLHFICPNGENNAPHFTDWLPIPIADLGIKPQELPTQELPSEDLGMTKKEQPKVKKPKTGTEPNE